MTTAWQKLNLLNPTPGTAWSKFSNISNVGTGTVISDGYTVSYAVDNPVIYLTAGPEVAIVDTSPLVTEISLGSITANISVTNYEVMIDSTPITLGICND